MQELLTHATIPKNMAFLLLKDGSYPLVLGTKKLVQLQIKVINVLTSSTIIIFIILIYPILISLTDFYKNKNYPEYIKTSVKLAFTIIPIIIFIHLGNETIVSN
jgi:heme/copper-type cytochrome/quinol oxidase subunit 2